MTTTYDPKDPVYFDEADVREELTRVYDLCHGCRLCFKFCTSFPTLFEMIDKHEDQDAGRLTPAEQDQVVDECFQCKLCYVNCPYIPELHEWNLDFPRLMLRADAMQYANGIKSSRDKRDHAMMGRTDLLGKLATSTAPSPTRSSMPNPAQACAKPSRRSPACRRCACFRRTPDSASRPGSRSARSCASPSAQGKVTVFPTCLVEYQEPGIGKDLVKVYERNGIECKHHRRPAAAAPLAALGQRQGVHEGRGEERQGPGRRGTRRHRHRRAAAHVQLHPQEGLSRLRRTSAATQQLVAEHTYDAAEYLMNVHKGDDTALDTDFTGEVPGEITYHTPCHLRAQNIGFKSRDLMKLTGAKVKLVQQCSGIDGMWGFRAENDDISVPIAKKLGEQITKAGGDAVAGDCHLANTAIVEQTGREAGHPLQIIARAYGIPEE